MIRKIACLNAIDQKGLDVFQYHNITENKDVADAWLVRSAKLHDQDFPSTLRAIGRAGAGVNNIPLDRCADEGIVVFNAPGANANGVSELVIAMMVLASRDIIGGVNWVQANRDKENITELTESEKRAFVGTELRGKTLGIIGLGAIGHLVANAAVGMGMKVIGYDPMIPVEYAWRLSRQVQHAETPEQAITQSDFVSLHIPLTDKTRQIVNKEQLDKMKTGAILLNFARDLLCDEDDVLDALESGKLRRYVVDFPNPKNVLFPNTIVTPHIGASTLESEEKSANMVAEDVKEYLEQGNIAHSVNYPAVSLGIQETETRIVALHRNRPNMITQISSMLGDAGYNIAKMISDSRGDYAAAIVDVNDCLDRDFIMQLIEHPDMLRIRVLHIDD